jgi:hypothetical protein
VAGDDRFAAPMVVAGSAHGHLIMAQLGDTPRALLVVEPCARNTDTNQITKGVLPVPPIKIFPTTITGTDKVDDAKIPSL